MATKKISELVAINEAASNDLLVIVDVSEGTTNKITKGDLLIGAGHSIEMSLNPATYTLTLTLKNEAGTELSTESIDLPNENAITGITYSNGILTLTKQSGGTSTVDISGLISGLQSEITNNNKLSSDLVDDTNKTNKFTNETEKATWNGKYNKPSGGIPKTDLSSDVQTSLEKADTALQAHQDISGKEDKSNKVTELSDSSTDAQYPSAKAVYNELAELKQENEDLKNNQLPWTPTPATSHYLQDSADMKTKRFDLIGRSTQESTTGASKFDLEDLMKIGSSTNYTPYYNGYSFTSINAMYTAGVELDTPITLPISFSYKIKNGTGANFRLKFWFDDGTNETYSNYGSGTGTSEVEITANNITKSGATKITRIGGDWSTGGTFSIRDFIINEGSTATSYEPYTGGEPAPNPDYEFPIKNCGDNVNLLPNTLQTGTTYNITHTVNSDGSITLNGTNGATSSWIKLADDFILPAGIYTISSGNDNASTSTAIFADDNNNFAKDKKQTKTFENNITIKPYIYVGANAVLNNFTLKPKLEKGTQATPYSPYGCGNVNEKIVNKNLFNGNYTTNGIWTDNGTINYSVNSGLYWRTDYIDISSNILYFSDKRIANFSAVILFEFDKNKNLITKTRKYSFNANLNDITINNNTKYIALQWNFDENVNEISTIFTDLQIEQGSTATSYVPHAEQNITFPLAQGQRLMEGDYLADDGIHHNKTEIILGNLNWEVRNDYTDENYVLFKQLGYNSLIYNKIDYCTHLRVVLSNPTPPENSIRFINSIGYGINILINKNIASTASELKEWLSTENVIAQLELATPTITPYTEEQQTAYNQIKSARTYKPVTHIFSEDETPANIDMTYYRDLETVINKIDSLEARIALLEE